MKKIGILTIIDNFNCGNRLQNYALQEILKKLDFDVFTIKNDKLLNESKNYGLNFLRYIKKEVKTFLEKKKYEKFYNFNKNIKFTRKLYTRYSLGLGKKFEYFIVGSDQVWKPTRKRMSYMDMLEFAPDYKKISYAASFGIDSLDEDSMLRLKKCLPTFKAISVREEAGKKIIDDLNLNLEVKVVLDPTMLIESNHWEQLENKQLLNTNEKYIFTYFLGDECKEQLNNFAKSKKLKIIDFYEKGKNYGPSDFLNLIHNAEYIFTDSFHGTVFSILYNKKFIVLNRKENAENNNMISRIKTLLKVFELEDRLSENLEMCDKEIDYEKVNQILLKNKNYALSFLKESLK